MEKEIIRNFIYILNILFCKLLLCKCKDLGMLLASFLLFFIVRACAFRCLKFLWWWLTMHVDRYVLQFHLTCFWQHVDHLIKFSKIMKITGCCQIHWESNEACLYNSKGTGWLSISRNTFIDMLNITFLWNNLIHLNYIWQYTHYLIYRTYSTQNFEN